MHSTIRALAFIALAAGGAFGSAASAQTPRDNSAEMERPEVREFRIRGVKSVDVGELRESLATEASGCLSLLLRPFCLLTKSHYVYERRYLDRTEFQRDVVRLLVFYFRRGYRDAQVDTTLTRARGGVEITMTVREGPPTLVTAEPVIDSGGVLRPRDIERDLRPKVGQPLNMLALDSSVIRLRASLWERGYADATIAQSTTVDDSTNAATVSITVDPKRRVTIAGITVQGNERVTEETIRNSLLIASGDLFRRSEIGRSQRSLYESNLFRRAVIDTAPGGGDTTKALVVRVQEGPLREARLRAGFTTADYFQADALFTHNYWLGGPRRLDLSATLGNLLAQQLTKNEFFSDIANIIEDDELVGRYYAPTYQISADVRQRWFQSPRNTIGAGIFTHRRSSPGVFVDRGYGANTTFTRDLAERTPASATYRFEISQVQAGDVYFCVNYGVCDNPTIDALRGRQRLSPVALTLSANRTDAPFSPTRGILARAEAEHASTFTASNFRYNRAFVDAAVYRQIGFRNSVLATHVRAGWVNALASTSEAIGGLGGEAGDILHPRKRFYAGGSQSVRGFGENQLGPRVLTVSPKSLAGAGCDTSSVGGLRACDLSYRPNPNGEGFLLSDNAFQTRPLGGTTLLEGNVELRIPIWRALVGAVFVDGAILGESSLSRITNGTTAITPGFGVRYVSPVGPIRVDLGIRPTLQEALPVITQITDSAGRRTLVQLAPPTGCENSDRTMGCRTYPNPDQKQGFITRLTNRLTLHLSIGEAF
jgi:outer membrane protein insertion porin family/translocation and assembly module TamA